jgi:hypothetical protein
LGKTCYSYQAYSVMEDMHVMPSLQRDGGHACHAKPEERDACPAKPEHHWRHACWIVMGDKCHAILDCTCNIHCHGETCLSCHARLLWVCHSQPGQMSLRTSLSLSRNSLPSHTRNVEPRIPEGLKAQLLITKVAAEASPAYHVVLSSLTTLPRYAADPSGANLCYK